LNGTEEKLAQLPLLFQGESANLLTPRVTIVTSNIPLKFLSPFFEIPRGWVISTLTKPNSIPENVVTFDLRTKTFTNGDISELSSSHLQTLLTEAKIQDWEILLQTSLRLLAAKAQSLAYLTYANIDAENIFNLLNITSPSELDLCIKISQADYLLDLSKFKKYSNEKIKTPFQQPTNEALQKLDQKIRRLSQETIHIDDVRTMLSSIMDTLTARGMPVELLTKTFNNALREWLPS
jgi:type III secretory pathway component EscV